MRSGESTDDIFTRFNKMLNQLSAIDIEYSQSKNATHPLTTINTKKCEIKTIAIEENVNLSDLTWKVLYNRRFGPTQERQHAGFDGAPARRNTAGCAARARRPLMTATATGTTPTGEPPS